MVPPTLTEFLKTCASILKLICNHLQVHIYRHLTGLKGSVGQLQVANPTCFKNLKIVSIDAL